MKRARILVCDDHKGLRDMAVSLLQTEFDVVGVVANGIDLLEAETTLHPEICVLDIAIPGLCGLEVASKLKARGSSSTIVVLTTYEDPDLQAAAFLNGATAYVVKSRMASDLCKAIHEALAGRIFVSFP